MSRIYFVILTVSLFLLSACGAGESSGGGDQTASTEPCATLNLSDTDSDGEGLPDCYEVFIGTSPVDIDSDGDGLDDYEEVVTKAFDSTINNFQFNPRIADVPKISVELQNVPDFEINFTSTTSGSQTRSLTNGNRTTSTLTRGSTYEQSVGEEVSSTLGSTGGTSGFDVSSSSTYSKNQQETMGWSSTQSQENSSFRESTNSETSEQGITETGGVLSVLLRVKNSGYQVVTLNSLTVTALRVDSDNPGQQQLVGGMSIDSTGAFPFDIDANQESSDLPFVTDLTLGKIYSLLSDSRNLSIEPTTWQIADAEGRSYTHNLTNVHARAAQVVIDYDNVNGRPIENHYVATVTDFGQNRVSAATALSEIIRADYSEGDSSTSYTGPNSGLLSVRNVANDDSISGRWLVIHNYLGSDGITRLSKTYDINRGDYSLDDIQLAKNETLHLMYYHDEDGDGLGSREEFLHGTAVDDDDSDDDLLTDFEEIKEGWEIPVSQSLMRTVYSDPLSNDADNDGLLDGMERSMGSNPHKRDTDNDGVLDSGDSAITLSDMREVAILPLAQSQFNDASINAGLTTAGSYDFIADRFGNPAAAIQINEDAHELTVDDIYAADPVNGASMLFWVKVDPNLPVDGWNLYELDNPLTTNGANQFFWIFPPGFTVFGDPFDRHSVFANQNELFTTLPFADWHMLAIVAEEDAVNDGMKTFRVYYDGELYSEVSHPSTLVEFVNEAWLFAGPSSYNVGLSEYRGGIDDIHYFQRALDDEEILLFYEAQP